MKWLRLIGRRILDFIVTCTVIILICVGVLRFGDYYVDSTKARINNTTGFCVRWQGGKLKVDVEDVAGESAAEYMTRLVIDGDGKWSKLKRQLDNAFIVRNVMRGLSIAIGLLGVISILGIVFRRDGLTQREGFVRVWLGVPKYFAGYFKKMGG